MKMTSKKLLSMLIIAVMIITTACGGNSKKVDETATTTEETTTVTENETTTPPEETGETTTIVFGTHYVQGLDPNYKDEVTGEYVMAETEREAYLAAEAAILEQLNVKFEYLQYAGDTREVLLQSVMAGDPICDIAWLWGGSEGTVLAQNILQPLDSYAPLFADNEYSWMLYDEIFGHNFFLGTVMRFSPRWPLVYNINYIEKVDSLKDENGKTIYPTQLFEEGNWTWSTFQDYLAKIDAYYANSSTPNRAERRIEAYQTDYRFAALSATYSNGGSVYGSEGLKVNAEETKEGVAYIKELMDKKLLTGENYDDSITPGWTWSGGNFQNGETVFTDIPDWMINGATTAAAERNESIGIVPWPRPDDKSADDPSYNQVMTASDSIGVLKGVSAEKTELALKALQIYFGTYYKTIGSVDALADYKDAYAVKQAAAFGFDVFHEVIGDSISSTYQYIAGKAVSNDYSDLFGMRPVWDTLVGNSIYGVDGTAAYDVAIEANINQFDNIIADMTAALESDEIKDNMPPSITGVADTSFAFAKGTDYANVDWSGYLESVDSIDGPLDIKNATIDIAGVDFETAGTYENGLKVAISDAAGNEKTASFTLMVFNPDNKVAPTITLVEDYRTIKLDEDTSAIAWSGDFVATAVDADGLNISKNIKADLSDLDTTTPGTYDVILTVADYVGNEVTETISITVSAE